MDFGRGSRQGVERPPQEALPCGAKADPACQILRNTPKTDPAGEPPKDYVERTNLAIDYIVRNLAAPLTLDEVAAVAAFSPFHFHRIFRGLLGETLNQFVKRQRLERALFLMSHAPGRSLTDIALDCGFSSSSDFSRSFKARYGVPPSVFDIETYRQSHRDQLSSSMAEHDQSVRLERLPRGENPDGFVATLRDLPARTVAYLRVLDPFQPDRVTQACYRLMEWADARGLGDGDWLGYMWEDPTLVELKDCRYDVAVVLPPDARHHVPDGEVGRFDFPPMTVAEVPIAGDIELEQRAIDWLFDTWLPSSGYEPDDQPAFEAWVGRPFAHGMEHFELACHLPVRR